MGIFKSGLVQGAFLTVSLALASVASLPVAAQTVDPFFAGQYSAVDLGSVTDVPGSYGGVPDTAEAPPNLVTSSLPVTLQRFRPSAGHRGTEPFMHRQAGKRECLPAGRCFSS